MRARKKSIETRRGKIGYYEIGEGKQDLVFLHGLLGTPKLGLDFAEQLDGNKWHVLVPYLPGHGLSFDPPENFGFDDYSGAIEEFIEASCVDELTLIGHSFGGSLVWDLLCRKKVSTKRAVMVAPFNNPRNRSIEELALSWMEDQGKKWSWIFDSGASEKHGERTYQGHVKSVKLEDLPKFISLFFSIKFPPLTTDVPTEIFYGEHDEMAPVKDWASLVEKQKNVKVVKYPGGHYFYQPNWEKFIAEIKEFI